MEHHKKKKKIQTAGKLWRQGSLVRIRVETNPTKLIGQRFTITPKHTVNEIQQLLTATDCSVFPRQSQSPHLCPLLKDFRPPLSSQILKGIHACVINLLLHYFSASENWVLAVFLKNLKVYPKFQKHWELCTGAELQRLRLNMHINDCAQMCERNRCCA